MIEFWKRELYFHNSQASFAVTLVTGDNPHSTVGTMAILTPFFLLTPARAIVLIADNF